jgi:hypothetical protein
VPSARCFLCDRSFQYGPYWYHGRFIRLYRTIVCNDCWNGASQGWPPEHERLLLARLDELRLPPPGRNAYGRLPRNEEGGDAA